MNPAILLALISDLYQQVLSLQAEVDRLRAAAETSSQSPTAP